MEYKSLATTIFVLIILIGGIWFTIGHFREETTTDDVAGIDDVNEYNQEDSDYERLSYVERIDAVQFINNGLHTFVGEVNLPTPCDLLEVDAVVMESMPEQIRLNFTLVNEDIDDEVACPQVITPQRFMVDIQASKEASVSAELMGRTIELNLRPPQAGETPDEFELFIKG